jgi:nucleoside-diphosphate-sugar epimerase
MATLITGGTGFIGAEIVRLLLKRGETKPVVLDLSPSTQRLDDVADRVDFLRGDLEDFSDVLNTVKASNPDVIYHLGGMLSSPSEAHPQAAMRQAVGSDTSVPVGGANCGENISSCLRTIL